MCAARTAIPTVGLVLFGLDDLTGNWFAINAVQIQGVMTAIGFPLAHALTALAV